jgi:hypothetical protein
MAQDPEHDEEQPAVGAVDLSHDLDLVPLYSSQTFEAEMEVGVIRSILDANGIPSVLSSNPYSNLLGFELKVPRNRLEEARRVIDEQRAAGPEAAAEAEAASEENR